MKIDEWIATTPDTRERHKLIDLKQRYELLDNNLFNQYEPTKKSRNIETTNFLKRMDKWLDQFETPEEQKIALRSIEYLFFAGIKEFDEMYRCAKIEVERHLRQTRNINPFDTRQEIKNEIDRCWFCPVTDSFKINSFLHINELTGHKYRPDFSSLTKFGDPKKINAYIRKQAIKLVVLLEDFSGSGNTIKRVIEFASAFIEIEILIVPLIACAPGFRTVMTESRKHRDISVRPVIIVGEDCLISPNAHDYEPQLFEKLRPLMKKHYIRIGGTKATGEYGYGNVGSMVVTYGNCPNNTPLIYRSGTRTDTILFPRISRV